jgi:hypothetical protein
LFLPQAFVTILGLLIAGVSGCSQQREPPRDPGQRFICADGQPLDIIHTKELAIVKFGERIFNLHARKASIGERYTDGDATLIMDDGTAVFVTSDGQRALTCKLSTEREEAF